MPYGVDERTWRLLPPDDRVAIQRIAEGKPVESFAIVNDKVVPVAPAAVRALQAAPAPPQAPLGGWVWVRNGSSFPGNAPDMADLKARGVTGVVVKADDPYRDHIAQRARDAGLLVQVWDDPHGETPAQYAERMTAAARAAGAAGIVADIEVIGKGYAGSAGWTYNEQVAEELRARNPQLALAVAPLPLQDDFNYRAWVNVGAQVWPQSYGSTLDQVFDPVAARDRVVANGVPAELVFPVLPAGSLAKTIPQLLEAGLAGFSIYTIDDVGAVDRQVPFGAPASEALQQGFDSPWLPVSDFAPRPELADVPLDGLLPAAPVDADDLEPEFEAGEEPTVEDYLVEAEAWRDSDGRGELRFLASTGTGPHLIGYPGVGTHSWTTPPNNWQSDNAVDIAMPPGTAILAVRDGVVSRSLGYGQMAAGTSSRFAGSRLHVEHAGGLISFYHHLRALQVRRGQRVARGQRIGDSGIANGVAHLHFAANDRNDPRAFWRDTFSVTQPRGRIPPETPSRGKPPVRTPVPETADQAWRALQVSRMGAQVARQGKVAGHRVALRGAVR